MEVDEAPIKEIFKEKAEVESAVNVRVTETTIVESENNEGKIN